MSIALVNSLKPWTWIFAVAYLVAIVIGQRYMSQRASFDLRKPLAVWNSMLALFSIAGARSLLPALVGSIRRDGLQFSVCYLPVFDDIETFWAAMFCVSKFFELGDTVFIVLRKKPLQLLHWYHHATVLIYSTYNLAEEAGCGMWYSGMNYTVHSLMYSYYAGTAFGIRFPKAFSMSITTLQLAQMIVGLVVQISVVVIKLSGGACQQSDFNSAFGLAVYLSYFVLFLQYFRRSYLIKTKQRYT